MKKQTKTPDSSKFEPKEIKPAAKKAATKSAAKKAPAKKAAIKAPAKKAAKKAPAVKVAKKGAPRAESPVTKMPVATKKAPAKKVATPAKTAAKKTKTVTRSDVEAYAFKNFQSRQQNGEYGTNEGDWQDACEKLGFQE